jgi:hypothetical protein
MSDVSDEILATEVDRAVCETRTALGQLAESRCLTPALMGLSTLLDRIEVAVTSKPGDDAFELVEDDQGECVFFRVGVLRRIFVEVAALASEIGDLEQAEANRAQQTAINLFVVHELMHIRQNFPHFATVSTVKAGLPGIGLPIFDLVADIVSAWVCAHVEAQRLGVNDADEVLPTFVNTLTLSYVIGAFVFDGRSSAGKRQRLLGLVVSAVLAKAKTDGKLRPDHLLNSWRPTSPVLVLNIEECRVFNAMVVDAMSGLLVGSQQSASDDAAEFWESVGVKPIANSFRLAALLLQQAGAIT